MMHDSFVCCTRRVACDRRFGRTIRDLSPSAAELAAENVDVPRRVKRQSDAVPRDSIHGQRDTPADHEALATLSGQY
jgi:hypothetical protein